MFNIRIEIPGYEHEYQIETDKLDIDEIEETVREHVWNSGYLSEVYGQVEHLPIGVFTEVIAEKAVKEGAKGYINSIEEQLTVAIYGLEAVGEHYLIQTLNIKDMLLKQIEDDASCGEFDCQASSYVEGCLQKYVSESNWYIVNNPEKPKPILWFGPSETIENSVWLIDLNQEVDMGIWFEEDEYYFLQQIGITDTQCFLIWFAECGCSTPDMADARKKCPIELDPDDDAESILSKLKTAGLC